jgi:hypothetical protein
MKDRDVINAFVAYLQKNGHPGIEVEHWPEDENRNSEEIDAIAGPFAIEHTSIDTLPHQRRDSDWFMQVVGGLEQEFSGSIPFRLSITLEYRAVKKGQSWSAIRNAIRTWLSTDALLLREGNHILDNIRGVPFRLHIAKDSGRPCALRFRRFDPGEDTTLSDRLRQLVVRKSKKLLRYQETGKTTLLLVESEDIALMNDSKMFMAIREAFPAGLSTGMDQLWYADTSVPSDILFRDFTQLISKRS